MEFVVKNSTGNLEKYFIDPETGTVHKVDITMSNNNNGKNKTTTKATINNNNNHIQQINNYHSDKKTLTGTIFL